MFRIPAERGDLTSALYRIGNVVNQQLEENDMIYEVVVNEVDFDKYGYVLTPYGE